jgi:glycosyltransferase involved in cell wall biosynthesis
MRITIDGSCWPNRRGFGRFTRSLVAEMRRRDDRNDYCLVIDEQSAKGSTFPEGIDIIPVRLGEPPARAAGADNRRTLRDMWRMSRRTRATRCDVVFFPASYTYFPVPGSPVVVTMHDATGERLPDLIVPDLRSRLRWKAKQFAATRQARALITVSEASRQAVIDALGVAPERLHVIREAPDPGFRPMPAEEQRPRLQRFGIGPGDRYLLYVGGISPHKNLEVLIAAFAMIPPEFDDLRLLLVGDLADDPFLSAVDAVRGAVAASPASERISFTGYVSDADLVALYSGAVATALPSLGEGFGLTAAESAACGTPVVCTPDPALVELLGDAGVYAPATDPAAFARCFEQLLADPAARDRAASRCLALAQGWSWEAAADLTVEVLERAGERRRG